MSPIATIYEEPKETKPYRSARPERDDGPVLETLFLEDLDVTKSASSYAPWPRAADAASRCIPRAPQASSGHDGQAEPPVPCIEDLIRQIEEARP